MEFELGGARDNGISGENVADNRNRVEEVSTMVGGGSSGGHLRYADSRLHGASHASYRPTSRPEEISWSSEVSARSYPIPFGPA